jgi:uncharacterized protein
VKRRILTFITGLALTVLGGCASSPTIHFYTLSPVAPVDSTPVTASYTVAVGLVSVPDTVDRPQMVMRLDTNRVALMEQARWAEPLQSGIGSVVAANLSRLLPGAWVTAYPQSANISADYQVAVAVQRFDSALGTAASVDVLWAVRDAKGAMIKAGRSAVSEPTQGAGNAALVAAHDRALAAVSRDIAQAIQASRPAS